VIEITCSRCDKNIDEYEQVTIVYNVATGDPSAIHESCGLPDDVKGVVLHHKDMTDNDMILLYYNMITYTEQRNQLQRDYTALNIENQGLLRYVRDLQLDLMEERNRYAKLVNRIRSLQIGEPASAAES
jgi:hypothetical protein